MKKSKASTNFLKQPILIAIVFGLVGFASVFALSIRQDKPVVNRESAAICEVSACVSLTETGAQPDTLTAKTGSTIRFNSADGKTHSLSLGKGGDAHEHDNKKFQSGDFKGDEAWEVSLNEEGSFYFHDHYNPKINILVVVYTEGKDYKITR